MNWKVLLFGACALLALGKAIWPPAPSESTMARPEPTPAEAFQREIQNSKSQLFEACLADAGTTLNEETAGQAFVTSYPGSLKVSTEHFVAGSETGMEISIVTRDLIDKEIIRKLSCHLIHRDGKVIRQKFLVARWGSAGWYPNCTGRSCF